MSAKFGPAIWLALAFSFIIQIVVVYQKHV